MSLITKNNIIYRTPLLGGRYGNILYGLLNNYIFSLKENKKYIYINPIGFNTISNKFIKIFNLQNIYNPNLNGKIKNNEIIFIQHRNDKPCFAEFGVDFTENQLNSFIKDVFLKNECFKKNVITNKLSIHIRGGDYLSPNNLNDYKFNSEKYLNISLLYFKEKGLTDIDIYSDDIKYAQSFNNIFKKYNFKPNFIINTTDVDDFINLSLYKNKILWNSTFSYWTGYISNVLFNNENYSDIFVPEYHVKYLNNGIAWHLNPKWNIIKGISL